MPSFEPYLCRAKLYRWVDEDHQSYGGFQWGGIGHVAVAKDFDPNPHLSCGFGLHGLLPVCGMAWELVPILEGGYLQEIEATRCVLSYCGRKYRFQKGVVVDEFPMPSVSALKRLNGSALVRAGQVWKCATPPIRKSLVEKLTGVYRDLALGQWFKEVKNGE